MTTNTKHFVIYCQVIDNFGDIGVCWRLAQQLRGELGQTVSLWVDDLNSLHAICPPINPMLSEQQHAGVTIYHWQMSKTPPPASDLITPESVVIEAFGCSLPADVIAQIKLHACQWLNLEYLAVEPWADDVHLASSPVHACRKTFFVPGFTARTGGLLMDDALLALASTPPRLARQNLCARFSNLSELVSHRWVSVFSYTNAPMQWLLDELNACAHPTLCLVSSGHSQTALQQLLGVELIQGKAHVIGKVTIVALPFLPQAVFDQVLAACDLNIVRGEDSAVRAQLLGKPFIWQLYPQAENAHHDKLTAFLTQFLSDSTSELAGNLEPLFRTWNGAEPANNSTALSSLLATPPTTTLTPWQAHCALWQKTLIKHGSLANNLFHFCSECV